MTAHDHMEDLLPPAWFLMTALDHTVYGGLTPSAWLLMTALDHIWRINQLHGS